MNRTTAAVLAAVVTIHASAATAEDVAFKGTVTDVFGHRVVVDAEGKKYLVNIGPKATEAGSLKAGDKLEVDGDLKNSGEVRAHNLTLGDGRKVTVSKDKKSWREWLMGDEAGAKKPFTVADARKAASDKGYTLTADPIADKKHFVGTATKDGKAVEIHIHRNGDIKERMTFSADDAKKAAAAKGYDVTGDPQRIRGHYEMLARKDGQYFELHARRNGNIKEARKLEKSDPRWGAQIP